MALLNGFGTATKQFPLVDPRVTREHRCRFRREYVRELAYANSYYELSGRWPDTGWLLLDQGSYSQLKPYATDLILTICDFNNAPMTISNLTVVQARCVTMGLVSDPNAIYLVQVTNTIGALYNTWFQQPVNKQYNMRAPAYDGAYYAASTNSGTAWTWDGMVGDLWAQAPAELGTYPHLPVAPAGTPEGFAFIGVPLWEAIASLMDYLGLTVAGSFPNLTIAVSGAADAAFAALQATYDRGLEDDMAYLDGGSGRVPSSVTVYFRRRNRYYGSEETVRDDSLQWSSTPLYSVNVAGPAVFAAAVGTGYIYADFTVRYDTDNNPVAADVTTAATIAAERVTMFYRTIYQGTQGFMRQMYAGVVPFTTGSLVDGVRWHNTGMPDDDYAGWRTEIVRGYVWDEATFPLNLKGITGPA